MSRPFRAGQWQRARADEWVEWRESSESLARTRLAALVAAITNVARGHLTAETVADAMVRQFPAVLHSCDSLNFDGAAETVSYMIWHLADRYGRVTQVVDRLFALGHLPIRLRGTTVLEVGAGPAPALYSVRDYYDDLRTWISSASLGIDAAPTTVLASIDRGPAWSSLLHQLSENLWSLSWPRPETMLPFSIGYANLAGFSPRDLHVSAIDNNAGAIEREFEFAGEDISMHAARQFALEDGGYPPSAYDMIIMCNFLTNTDLTQRFEAEIAELTRSLTPGGILLVLGGHGGNYPAIYERLRGIVAASRLHQLTGFEEPLKAHSADWQRHLISAQIRSDVAFASAMSQVAFRGIATELPTDIVKLDETVDFPQFRVHAWKNEWQRRSRSDPQEKLQRISRKGDDHQICRPTSARRSRAPSSG
jgi:hypothetical protein